jgi:Na+/melibiose symporter-like transporter
MVSSLLTVQANRKETRMNPTRSVFSPSLAPDSLLLLVLSLPSSSSSSPSLHDHQFSLIFPFFSATVVLVSFFCFFVLRTTRRKRAADGEEKSFSWLMISKPANHSKLWWLSQATFLTDQIEFHIRLGRTVRAYLSWSDIRHSLMASKSDALSVI